MPLTLEGLYPAATANRTWSGVPTRWVCDPSFDAELKMGVTLGCPDGWVLLQLIHLWDSAGSLAQSLLVLGEIGVFTNSLDSGSRIGSGKVEELRGRALDILGQAEALDRDLRSFSDRMLRAGFLFPVYLDPRFEKSPIICLSRLCGRTVFVVCSRCGL